MKLILCCKFMSNVNWQTLVDSIPCLLWGVIGLVASWLILKYVAKPLIQNCNDAKTRREKFEREKFWKFYDKVQLNSDETLKNKIKELEKKIEELKKDKEKDNKEQSNKNALLNKEIEIYQTILNQLNVMIKIEGENNKQ